MQRLEDLEDISEMNAAVETKQAELMEYAEAQLRKLCASRKLNWDKMSEAERDNSVNDLILEDRE